MNHSSFLARIQRGCVYDGPGIRTTIFLHGCNLCCPWCCNPESYSELEKPSFPCGLVSEDEKIMICEKCERYDGDRKIDDCPLAVFRRYYDRYTVAEILEKAVKDVKLFERTGGGVTFSGGEPLLHSDLIVELSRKLLDYKVSSFVETSLYVDEKILHSVQSFCNGFIIDLKLQPEMYLYDDEYKGMIIRNLSIINNKTLLYRLVYVPSLSYHAEEVFDFLKKASISKLEVLCCHSLAKNKYKALGIDFKDYSAKKEDAQLFVDHLISKGILTNLLTV